MNELTAYLEQFYDEVEPRDFYRAIFPEGDLQKKGELREKGSSVYKYNGIIVSVTNKKKANGDTLIKRYTLTDDLDMIDEVCQTEDFSLMSPISYVGKERTAENARVMYAIAVDLDKIRIENGVPVGLISLLERHIELAGRIPKPTYIVSSGTGLHLYYVLSEPINLFKDTAKQLQIFKHDLTDLIWHDTICDIKSKKEIQQEGIYQGFRVVGTVTKTGDRARAYQIGDPVSMEYLNRYILNEAHRVTDLSYKRKGLTLQEAKEKYPEWYESRVVRKVKRGSWHISRNLYEWWKRQILSGATVGHRYHCMTMLAIYAQKCSMYDPKHNPDPVTREELERDAWKLFDHMESLTIAENNHFTTDDVMKALLAFDEKWIIYPRRSVEYKSGIYIPANKRNGRKQADHIRLMNFVRDEINHNTDWRNKEGRPDKIDQVRQWRQDHPEGKKADCIRETGLSKSTVYRHWEKT
ncbi:MAG: hypothetical protein J6A59_10220 [Lachnospiraceae bacterium]|nr:hypothetical protein [Lachnospiraceae bacterium]